jgi:TetR/AcrR family transcriptional regulator, repressor for neighboring sulfatase
VEERAERSWKVIARALLDGFAVGGLQHRFPNVDELVAVARQHHRDDGEARLAAADALAQQLGWRLFGPFLRAATGLPESVPRPTSDIVESLTASSGKPVPRRRS